MTQLMVVFRNFAKAPKNILSKSFSAFPHFRLNSYNFHPQLLIVCCHSHLIIRDLLHDQPLHVAGAFSSQIYSFSRTLTMPRQRNTIILQYRSLRYHSTSFHAILNNRPRNNSVVSPWPLTAEGRLNLRQPHVGFVVDKVVLGQVFPASAQFCPGINIPPITHSHASFATDSLYALQLTTSKEM
jgi:hypothetical protein